jgi:hypothetical protein
MGRADKVACRHSLQVTQLMRVAVGGEKTLLKVSRELTLEGTLTVYK